MPDHPPPFDLDHARQAFITAAQLHGEATRRGAPALTPADFDRLRAADAEHLIALREGRVDDAIRTDNEFHRVLLDAAGDPDLQVSVELLLPRLHPMDRWIFRRKVRGEGGRTHPAIIAALEAGDVETAARLVEDSHLEAGEALAGALDPARNG
jgi:DNA-binding GntR family transcriptional regulator